LFAAPNPAPSVTIARCITRAQEDPIMEPTNIKSGTTGVSQTEGQSLSPDTRTNTTSKKTDVGGKNQDNAALSGTGNKANQPTGYGKSTNR
jgi:hypothetical protein